MEVLIILVYFALEVRAQLTASPPPGPSASWQTTWLTIVYGLYVIWDLLDVRIAQNEGLDDWKKRAIKGGVVSAVFLLLFGVLRIVVWRVDSQSQGFVFAVDIAALLLLYVYRLIQEAWQGEIKPQQQQATEPPATEANGGQ